MFLRRLCLVAALALSVVSPCAHAGEVGVNIFGFSHHFKNPYDDDLSEFNPGLGAQWTFARSARASLEINGGVYRDSFAHANYHLSLGGRVRAGGPFEFGLQLINAKSQSLNDDHPVVTPYPFVAVRTPRATIHLTYMPELKSFNGLPAMATFVTVYPWGDRAARRARDLDETASTRSSALEFNIDGLGTLSGLGGYSGLMWRNMFDDRNGLRLGGRLTGYIVSSSRGDVTDGPSGTFTAEVLMQYLRRQQPHGPLRTYWATGLQTMFYGGSPIEETHVAWQSDFGVEYSLTPDVALLVEYGLALRYERDAFNHPDFPDAQEFVQLASSGAQLKLVTAWGRTGDGVMAAAAATTLPSGPIVELAGDLHASAFSGYGIGWRWASSPTRGWRLVGSPLVDRKANDGHRLNNYALNARAERIRRQPGTGGLSSYWGYGPILALRYTEYLYDADSSNGRANDHYLVLTGGATAVVGVDYALGAHVQVLAEYSADLSMEWGRNSGDSRSTTWRFGNDKVRLGLGTTF